MLQRGFQHGEIERLGQVGEEAGGVAAFDVGLHAVPAERDSAQAMAGLELTHQIVAAAVREPEITDHHIEGIRAATSKGVSAGGCECDEMSAPGEEAME